MKKSLLLFILLFCILILLPTFLALCLSKPKEFTDSKDIPTVAVLHTDTGNVENENIEAYLIGVVAAEMPASFHSEALKAQAVAARTYIYNHMVSEEDNEDHPEADVCTNSAHCKAWLSDTALRTDMGESWYAEYYDKIAEAVQSTAGEIITYDNEPIVAVFHSTGSGRTENSADVWGGDLPYLKSVESSGDSASPKFSSTVTVPKSTISETLGVIDTGVYEYTRSEGGAVLTVNIGGYLFRGTDIRSYFNLNSSNFEIEETETEYIFHVTGNGHGVGMSQYGANAMAQSGSDYASILTAYYTDVALTVAW